MQLNLKSIGLLILLSSLLQSALHADDSAEVLLNSDGKLRKVGNLQLSTNSGDRNPYRLKDVWEQQRLILHLPRRDDVDAFLNREVAVYFSSPEVSNKLSSHADSASFEIERIVALDGEKPARVDFKGAVQPASFEFQVEGAVQQPQGNALPLGDATVGEAIVGDVLTPKPEVDAEFPFHVETLPAPFAGRSAVDGEIIHGPDAIGIPTDFTGGELVDGEFVGNEVNIPLDDLHGPDDSRWLGSRIHNWLQRPGRNCGPGEQFWFSFDLLSWWSDSLRTPPLITTSPNGTARETAGVLGENGTTIRFGTGSINNDPHTGVRLRAGMWMGPSRTFGIEADYYGLDDQNQRYRSTSAAGDPIIARPFFDVLAGRETAQLVAFPGVVGGTIDAHARTELHSGGIRLRLNQCCQAQSCCGGCRGCGQTRGTRLDWLVGYRFFKLEDDVRVRENLTSLDTANPGTFAIRDWFSSENRFHGIELGVLYEKHVGRMSLEFISKVALGSNSQTVHINGSSTIDEAGFVETFEGGVLAQRSNIGNYERGEFAMIPELGVNLAWHLNPNISFTMGYTLVYFSNVVRAGDQISTDLNPNLFPPEADPFAGALRPEFEWRESDFWVQGLNFGGRVRW